MVKVGVGERLASYMVPSQIMVLDALPLNASGKLDRKLLPEPVFETAVFRAPVTAVEEIVASVFAEVLGVDRVGCCTWADRKSTRLNSSHNSPSRMPSSA